MERIGENNACPTKNNSNGHIHFRLFSIAPVGHGACPARAPRAAACLRGCGFAAFGSGLRGSRRERRKSVDLGPQGSTGFAAQGSV